MRYRRDSPIGMIEKIAESFTSIRSLSTFGDG